MLSFFKKKKPEIIPVIPSHLELQVQKLVNFAVIPEFATEGSAGFDLVATSVRESSMYIEYGTGLAFKIPEGHVGLLFPRSSVSNYDLSLANAVGVIDGDFTGEVKLRFRRKSTGSVNDHVLYTVGDRVGQMVVVPTPKIKINHVPLLSETTRGSGGFGSTGS